MYIYIYSITTYSAAHMAYTHTCAPVYHIRKPHTTNAHINISQCDCYINLKEIQLNEEILPEKSIWLKFGVNLQDKSYKTFSIINNNVAQTRRLNPLTERTSTNSKYYRLQRYDCRKNEIRGKDIRKVKGYSRNSLWKRLKNFRAIFIHSTN